MTEQYFIYILTNRRNTTLYTGITNDIVRRVYEHKARLKDGFTKRYNLEKLVYFELTESVDAAIAREKQIKQYSRARKLDLIDQLNPEWNDLYHSLV